MAGQRRQEGGDVVSTIVRIAGVALFASTAAHVAVGFAQALSGSWPLSGFLSWLTRRAINRWKKRNEKHPSDKPIRVYLDGCFDMMHYGHANALRQAKQLGDVLVVGIVADDAMAAVKGPPVLTLEERAAMVREVKWVDEVLEGVPYDISPAFLRSLLDDHGIDYVIHGSDPCLLPDGTDAYADVKKEGRYLEVPRTEGISSTEIVGRMLLCVGSRQAERPHVSFEDFYASPERERERERSVSLPVSALQCCRESDSAVALSLGEWQLQEMKELVCAGSARAAAAATAAAMVAEEGRVNGVERMGCSMVERNGEGNRVSEADSPPCCRSLSASAALPSRLTSQRQQQQQQQQRRKEVQGDEYLHDHHLPHDQQQPHGQQQQQQQAAEGHAHLQHHHNHPHQQDHAAPLPLHLHVHQHLAFEFATAFTSSLSPSEPVISRDVGRVVYMDGAFDVFHSGHVATLQAAKAQGDFLLVGIHSDALVRSHRGPHHPIMNLHERALSLLSCRSVDHVLLDVPWAITREMISSFNISLVVHGTVAENNPLCQDEDARYSEPKSIGIFRLLDSRSQSTTTSIMRRILDNHQAYVERHAKKNVQANV